MSAMRSVIHLLPEEDPTATTAPEWREWATTVLPLVDRLVDACRVASRRGSCDLFLIGKGRKDNDDEREQRLPDGGALRLERIDMHSNRIDEGLTLIDRDRTPLVRVLAESILADGIGDPRTWPLRLAASGRAAMRDMARGAAIPYSHPDVATAATETLARSLDRPEMLRDLHGNTQRVEGSMRTSCPWNDGYGWVTVDEAGDRRNVPLPHADLPALPDMMILRPVMQAVPCIALRCAYLWVEDCRPDRSPIVRLRDSGVLDRLIARATRVDGDPQGSGPAAAA